MEEEFLEFSLQMQKEWLGVNLIEIYWFVGSHHLNLQIA